MPDRPSASPQAASSPAGRQYGRKSGDERRRERRERMLAAGLEAFGTRGYGATTIDALCAAANVSTRNFYEEFGSRETLLIALHDDLNARALTAVVAALGDVPADDVAARATAATAAYLDVMTSDRRWARIALVESVGVSSDAEAARRSAIDGFVALVQAEAQRLAAAGVIPDRDHRLTAIALAGALNGLVNTWTAETEWDGHGDAIAAEASRLIVLGLTG